MSKLKDDTQYNFESHLLAENEEIEIQTSCLILNKLYFSENSQVQLCLYTLEKNEIILVDETEILPNSTNLNFKESLLFPYSYNWSKILNFQLLDVRKPEKPILVAQSQFTLKDLLISKNRKALTPLLEHEAHVGDLKMKWDIPKSGKKFFEFTPTVTDVELSSKVWMFKSVPLAYSYNISRLTATSDFMSIYQSESVTAQKKLTWKPVTLSAMALSKTDMDRPLTFSLYSSKGKNKEMIYAQTIFSLETLSSGKCEYSLACADMQSIKGKLDMKHKIIEDPYVLDYVRSGIKFNYLYGIDYSDSSYVSEQKDWISYHLSLPGKTSKYYDAITHATKILDKLNINNKFGIFGFGRSLDDEKLEKNESHSCFSLSDHPENPWIENSKDISKLYTNTVQDIRRGGRSILSKFISRAVLSAKYHKFMNTGEYTIAVVFTEGKIIDLKQIITLIEESDSLPISLILVGIGDGDFESLEIFDGDEAMRKKGRRDHVKFVKFSDYEKNESLFTYEMLRKLPHSIKDYTKIQYKITDYDARTTSEIMKLGDEILKPKSNIVLLKRELDFLLENKQEIKKYHSYNKSV